MTLRPYTLRDIAELTGRSYDWVSRIDNRRKLFKAGLPRPLALPGRPVWSRERVDAFVRGDSPGVSAAEIKGGPDPLNARDTTNIVQLDLERNRLRDSLLRDSR